MRSLKQLTKYTLLIVASLITFFAAFGFFINNTSSKWYAIILLALICTPMFYLGIKIKIEPKQPKINKQIQPKEKKLVQIKKVEAIIKDKPEVILTNEQKTFIERTSNFIYSSQLIKGKIYQALESIEIIGSTKNLDTLISRYDFLTKIYDDIKMASLNPIYKNDFQKALDEYKQMYYNVIPTQNQLNAIVKPLEFDLHSFYYISTYQCFVRNYEFQTNQIELLKTEKGKQGRYKKLLENLYLTKKIVELEIMNNENAKLIFEKLSEVEMILKPKTY